MPRRRIEREYARLFNNGHLVATLHFLGPIFSKRKHEDEEIAREVLRRYEQYWRGKLCVVFTADCGFFDQVKEKFKGKPVIVITIPRSGKHNFTSREVEDILRKHVIKKIRVCYFCCMEKGRRTVPYLKKKFHQFP